MITATIVGLVLLVVYFGFIGYAPFIKAEFKAGVELFKGLYSKQGLTNVFELTKETLAQLWSTIKALLWLLTVLAAPITLPILLVIKVLADGHAARQK